MRERRGGGTMGRVYEDHEEGGCSGNLGRAHLMDSHWIGIQDRRSGTDIGFTEGQGQSGVRKLCWTTYTMDVSRH